MFDKIPSKNALASMRMHQNQMTGGDDTLTYAQTGEIVIPKAVQDKFPQITIAALGAIRQAGGNPGQYVVGHPQGNYNDETGAQEFSWVSKAFDYVANNRWAQSALTGLGTAAAAKIGGASGKQAITSGLGASAGYYAGDWAGDAMSRSNQVNVINADTNLNKTQKTEAIAKLSNSPKLVGDTTGQSFGNAGNSFSGAGMTGAALGGSLGLALAPTPPPPGVNTFDKNAPSSIDNIPISVDPRVINTQANQLPNLTATIPQDLPLAPMTPGVNYLTSVINRDTGLPEYISADQLDNAAFSRSIDGMAERRRSGFGNRFTM